MQRWIPRLLIGFLVTLGVTLICLISTQWGLVLGYSLLSQKQQLSQEQLSEKQTVLIEDFSGSLWSGFSLNGVRILLQDSSSFSQINIDHIYINIDLSDLWLGRVRLNHVWIDTVEVVLTAGQKKEKTTIENIFYGLKLPHLEMPFIVEGGDIYAKKLTVVDGQNRLSFSDLKFLGAWHGKDWVIQELSFTYPEQFTASIKGYGQTVAAYPLTLNVMLSMDESRLKKLPVRETPLRQDLHLLLQGDLQQIKLFLKAQGVVSLSAEGVIEPDMPKMPFSIKWDMVTPALSWQGMVSLQDAIHFSGIKGEGILEGDLQHYTAEFEGITETSQGEHALKFYIDGRPKSVKYAGEISSHYGHLILSGDYIFLHQKGDASLHLQRFMLGEFFPSMPVELHGLAHANFELKRDAKAFIDVHELSGFWKEQPFHLAMKLNWQSQKTPALRDLTLTYGKKVEGKPALIARGSLDKEWQISMQYDQFNLFDFLPEIKGKISGNLEVSGPFEKPDLFFRLVGRDIKYPSFSAKQVLMQGEVLKVAEDFSFLHVVFDRVFVSNERIDSITIDVAGNQVQHEIDIRFLKDQWQGFLAASGVHSEKTYQLAVENFPIHYQKIHWSLKKPMQFLWQKEQNIIELSEGCLENEWSHFCINYQQKNGLSILNTKIQSSDLTHLNQVDAPWWLDGAFLGEGQAKWGDKQPFVFSGQIDGAALSFKKDPHSAQEIIVHEFRLTSQYDQKQWQLQGDARANTGLFQVEIALNPSQPRNLNGKIKIENGSLAPFALFLDDGGVLKGKLQGDLSFDGELQQLAWNGSLAVTEGFLSLPRQKAKVDGRYQVAKGKGQLVATIDWSEPFLNVDASIVGERFQFVYDAPSEFWVSPDLKLQVKNKKINLSGNITLDQAKVLKKGGSQKIALSKDVVVEEEVDQKLHLEDFGDFGLDLNLNFGKKVEFDVYGAKGKIAGALKLSHVKNHIYANGELNIQSGQYTAWGQELKIRKGIIDFNGPIDRPVLEIQAVREVKRDNVVAGLTLQGSAQNLVSNLFIEPFEANTALSQAYNDQQILSYILLGRSTFKQSNTEETQNQEQTMMTQAAVALGLKGGKSLVGRTPDKWGLKEVEIDTTGSGNELQLVVGKAIKEDLYIQYSKGVFAPIHQTILKYQLSSKWYLEAVSGLEQALDLIYSISF